jgi:hypothetical protein
MTKRTKASDIELYIVVCNDLHLSTGPFTSPELALEIAKRLNKKGHCVFVPVPFVMQGEIASIDEYESPRRKRGGKYEPTGYL